MLTLISMCIVLGCERREKEGRLGRKRIAVAERKHVTNYDVKIKLTDYCAQASVDK